MSVKAMNWAWDVAGLSPTERLVLLKLADNADREHHCWPSVPYLAAKCCCAPRTVERTLAALVKKRLIERKEWPGPNGSRKGRAGISSYLYTLQVNEPGQPEAESSPRQNDDPCETPAPDIMTGRQNDGGDTGDTQPSTSTPPAPDTGDTQPPTNEPRARREGPTTNPQREPTTEPQGQPPEPPVADSGANGQGQGEAVLDVWDANHPNPRRPEGDVTPVVLLIPLKDKEARPLAVTKGLLDRWSETYNRIDVEALMRHVREWCFNHPGSLVTPAKVRDWLINVWLSKEQGRANQGRSKFAKGAGGGPGAGQQPSYQEDAIARARGARVG